MNTDEEDADIANNYEPIFTTPIKPIKKKRNSYSEGIMTAKN